MGVIKVYIGNVTYNRRTKERRIEVITEEERDYREKRRKDLERKIALKIKREKELDKKAKKKRPPRKGGMRGKWMKNVYGQ
jgi:hypothetical protein